MQGYTMEVYTKMCILVQWFLIALGKNTLKKTLGWTHITLEDLETIIVKLKHLLMTGH